MKIETFCHKWGIYIPELCSFPRIHLSVFSSVGAVCTFNIIYISESVVALALFFKYKKQLQMLKSSFFLRHHIKPLNVLFITKQMCYHLFKFASVINV